MAFKYAIVLTGSIATGKSTVAKILKSYGCEIIDADSIAHKVLDEQYQEIAKRFGDELIVNNRVNRKALGAIVFSNESKRKSLEALLHPLIYSKIEGYSKILDEKNKIYFIDIPLFFESNRYPIEKSLLVYTPQELQLKRLKERDSLHEEEAIHRIELQISIEEKRKKATYVIDNSGTLAELKQKCERIKKEILHDCN